MTKADIGVLVFLVLVALYFVFRNKDRRGKWDE